VTFIIADPCIDVKDLACLDVCPVDCIHEANRILVIDPEECIDCAACEPECPVEAIFPEDALPRMWEPFIRINYAYGEGLSVVDRLVEEWRGDDDGSAGVREPRTPPPTAPGDGERSTRPWRSP
jgi:ferredoxin